MASTFGGINTALTSLYAQRRGLDVTGQNIANANTEGYSRQRVNLSANAAPATGLYSTAQGLAGNGVSISDVVRLRDAFLEGRGRAEHTKDAVDQVTIALGLEPKNEKQDRDEQYDADDSRNADGVMESFDGDANGRSSG